MCEVLKSNFDKVFPRIEEAVKIADFIGIVNQDRFHIFIHNVHFSLSHTIEQGGVAPCLLNYD